MFCVSISPETLACALANPGLKLFALPILSCMYCIDRFSTFWRFAMNSSDEWAKEKECRDSEGNRFKSSDIMAGDAGPEVRLCNMVKDVERERLMDGLREVGFEGPVVPAVPLRGCDCLILLNPPDSPWSWSDMMGDLVMR